MANKNITGVSFSIVFLLAFATGVLLSASFWVSFLALIVIFLFLIAFLRSGLLFFLGICSAGFYNIAVLHTGAMDIRPFQIVWSIFFLSLILKAAIGKGKVFHKSPILLPLILIIVANFLSVFESNNPLVSVRETVQTVYFVFLFMSIVGFVNSTNRLEKSIKTLLIVTVLFVLFGILQATTGILPFPQMRAELTSGSLGISFVGSGGGAAGGKILRSSSFFLGPVGTANYLLFSLPLILTLQTIPTMRKQRFLLVILIMGIGLLLLTFSRAGWIAFAFILIIYFLLQKRRKYIGIVLLLGLVLVMIMVPPIKSRIGSLINPLEDTSIRGHLALYKSALKLFSTSPILGIGAGMFPHSLGLTASIMYEHNVPYLTAGDTHNLLLQTLAETGLVGLIGLLLFFYIFYTQMARALRIRNLGKYRIILVGFTLSALGGLLMNLTMNGFRFETFWVFYGLAYASAEIALRRSSETDIIQYKKGESHVRDNEHVWNTTGGHQVSPRNQRV